MNEIKKTIHYIWLGGNRLPPLHKECISTWKGLMPNWEIKLWNEDNLPVNNLFVNRSLREKKYAFAADYLRCHILYEFGGVYLDADMELVKPIDELITKPFMGLEAKGRVANGIMCFPEKHWFLKELMNSIEKEMGYKTIPLLTSNILSSYGTIKANSYVKDIFLYDKEYFYPYNPYDPERPRNTLMYKDVIENTYAIHHWAKGWEISFKDMVFKKIRKVLAGLK